MNFDMDCMGEIKENNDFSHQIYSDNMSEAVEYAVKDLVSKISTTESEEVDSNARINLTEEVRRYEVSLIVKALKLTGGNQRKAAKLLGIRHTTLNSKIKRHKISI